MHSPHYMKGTHCSCNHGDQQRNSEMQIPQYIWCKNIVWAPNNAHLEMSRSFSESENMLLQSVLTTTSIWLSLIFLTRGPKLAREGGQQDHTTKSKEVYYPLSTYHFTARFCTSPFLSSTSRSTLCTTFLSESSSSLMESFWSSVIRSLVAMKRKSLSTEPIWRNETLCYTCIHLALKERLFSAGKPEVDDSYHDMGILT